MAAGACCATALRKASRRLTQLYDNALMPSGLRSTQYAILAELGRRADEPPTVQELASATDCLHSEQACRTAGVGTWC